MVDMHGTRRVLAVGAFALLLGSLASVVDEVFGESGITCEEGHPTAYGGVWGCNPPQLHRDGIKDPLSLSGGAAELRMIPYFCSGGKGGSNR